MGRRTLPLNFGGGAFLDKPKWMEFPCERGPLPKTTTWMDWWLEDAAVQSWNPLGNLITSLLFGERALFMRLYLVSMSASSSLPWAWHKLSNHNYRVGSLWRRCTTATQKKQTMRELMSLTNRRETRKRRLGASSIAWPIYWSYCLDHL